MRKVWEDLPIIKEFVKGVERVSEIELDLKGIFPEVMNKNIIYVYNLFPYFLKENVTGLEKMIDYIKSTTNELKITDNQGYIKITFKLYNSINIQITFRAYINILEEEKSISSDELIALFRRENHEHQ